MFRRKPIMKWGQSDVVEFMLAAQHHLAVKFQDIDFNFSNLSDVTRADLFSGNEQVFKQFSAKHWKILHKYFLDYKASEELRYQQETKFKSKLISDWEYADVVGFMLAAWKQCGISHQDLDFNFTVISSITGTQLLELDVSAFHQFSANHGERLYQYFCMHKSREKQQECSTRDIVNGDKDTSGRDTISGNTDKSEFGVDKGNKNVHGGSNSSSNIDKSGTDSDVDIIGEVSGENRFEKEENDTDNVDMTGEISCDEVMRIEDIQCDSVDKSRGTISSKIKKTGKGKHHRININKSKRSRNSEEGIKSDVNKEFESGGGSEGDNVVNVGGSGDSVVGDKNEVGGVTVMSDESGRGDESETREKSGDDNSLNRNNIIVASETGDRNKSDSVDSSLGQNKSVEVDDSVNQDKSGRLDSSVSQDKSVVGSSVNKENGSDSSTAKSGIDVSINSDKRGGKGRGGGHIPVLIRGRTINRFSSSVTVTPHHFNYRPQYISVDQKRKLEASDELQEHESTEQDNSSSDFLRNKRRRHSQCMSEEEKNTDVSVKASYDDTCSASPGSNTDEKSDVIDLLLEEVSDDDMGFDEPEPTPQADPSQDSGEDGGMDGGFIITDEVSSDEFENDPEELVDSTSVRSDMVQEADSVDPKPCNTEAQEEDSNNVKGTSPTPSETEPPVPLSLNSCYTAVVTTQNMVKVFYRANVLNRYLARLQPSKWPVQIVIYAAVREQKIQPILGSYLNSLMPLDMWTFIKQGQYQCILNKEQKPQEANDSCPPVSDAENPAVDDEAERTDSSDDEKPETQENLSNQQRTLSFTGQFENEIEKEGEGSGANADKTEEKLEAINVMLENLEEVSDDDDLGLDEQQHASPANPSQVSDEEFCDLDEMDEGFIITDEVSSDDIENDPMELDEVTSARSDAARDTLLVADDEESIGSVGEDFMLSEFDSADPQQKVALFGHSYVSHYFLEKPRLHPSFLLKLFASEDASVATIKNDAVWQDLLNYQPDLTFMSLGVNDITATSSLMELASSIENIAKEIEEKTGGYCIIMGLDSGSHPEGMSLDLYNKLKNGLNKRLSSKLSFAKSRYRVMKVKKDELLDNASSDDKGDELFHLLIKTAQTHFECKEADKEIDGKCP